MKLNVTDPKRAIIVVHSEVGISYPLKSELFTIRRIGDRAEITLPPPRTNVSLKDIEFYDKESGKWLMFEQAWTAEDDTQIIRDAKADVEERAVLLLAEYRDQYELVAESLVKAIASGLGCDQVEVTFERRPEDHDL